MVEIEDIKKQVKSHLVKVLLVGGIATVVWFPSRVYNDIKKEYQKFHKETINYHKEQVELKNAIVIFAHVSFYNRCREHLKDNYIHINDLHVLESMYKSYKIIGGNGTAEELYKRCTKLNIVYEEYY